MRYNMKVKTILFILVMLIIAQVVYTQTSSALDLVTQQTEAYNKRSIEAFLTPYADDVEIFNFPNERLVKGKQNLKTQYETLFKQFDRLRITVYKQAVLGKTIVNWEMTTGFPDYGIIELIAIYKIKNGKIAQVYLVN